MIDGKKKTVHAKVRLPWLKCCLVGSSKYLNPNFLRTRWLVVQILALLDWMQVLRLVLLLVREQMYFLHNKTHFYIAFNTCEGKSYNGI